VGVHQQVDEDPTIRGIQTRRLRHRGFG
jgi:hypothetical protein